MLVLAIYVFDYCRLFIVVKKLHITCNEYYTERNLNSHPLCMLSAIWQSKLLSAVYYKKQVSHILSNILSKELEKKKIHLHLFLERGLLWYPFKCLKPKIWISLISCKSIDTFLHSFVGKVTLLKLLLEREKMICYMNSV